MTPQHPRQRFSQLLSAAPKTTVMRVTILYSSESSQSSVFFAFTFYYVSQTLGEYLYATATSTSTIVLVILSESNIRVLAISLDTPVNSNNQPISNRESNLLSPKSPSRRPLHTVQTRGQSTPIRKKGSKTPAARNAPKNTFLATLNLFAISRFKRTGR